MTASENNRRARVYTITAAGRKRLTKRIGAVGRVCAVDAARPADGPMMTRLLASLRGRLRRRRIEGEIAEELQDHLEREIAAHEARGVSPDEARRLALRDLGGLVQTTRRHARCVCHMARQSLARLPLCRASAASCSTVHRDCADTAGRWHRINDGDYFGRVCRPAAAAAVSESRAFGLSDGEGRRRHRLAGLPGLANPRHVVRRSRQLAGRRGSADERPRAEALRVAQRDGELLPGDRFDRVSRPALRRGRFPARGRRDGCRQSRLLAARAGR